MQYDEVESISLMAGAYDFAVTVKGANVKDVSLFVSQRLAPLGNVLSTATYFVLKKYKEMGKIVVDEERTNGASISRKAKKPKNKKNQF